MALTTHLRTKVLILLAAAGSVCVVDQVTKALAISHFSTDHPSHIVGPLYLTKLVNDTSSISYLYQSSLLLEILRLVLIAAVTSLAFYAAHTRVRVLCALVIGGIISNALDHWTHPAFLVVDFIKVGNIATFNVADVTVVMGIAGLAVCFVPFITHPLDFVRARRTTGPALVPDPLSV